MMTGIELAQKTDADVIGIGEMGIGNTTTSSAVAALCACRLCPNVRGYSIPSHAFLPFLSAAHPLFFPRISLSFPGTSMVQGSTP